MLASPILLKAIYAMCGRSRMKAQFPYSQSILHHQCGHWRNAVTCRQPRRINSRQACYQQKGSMHAQCKMDIMSSITQPFLFKRFITFSKTPGNTNHLCLWAVGDGPRPDSSKGSGLQLLVFSGWLSYSHSRAKWSAGSWLAAFVMFRGEWRGGQGYEFSSLMGRNIPNGENNVPRLMSPALSLTEQLSNMCDLSPRQTHQGRWWLSLSQSPPRRQFH